MGKSYPSGKIHSLKPKIVFKEIRVNPTVTVIIEMTYNILNYIDNV